MAGNPKNNPAVDLMASLLKEVEDDSNNNPENLKAVEIDDFEPLELNPDAAKKTSSPNKSNNSFLSFDPNNFDAKSSVDYEKTRGPSDSEKTSIRTEVSSVLDLNFNDNAVSLKPDLSDEVVALKAEPAEDFISLVEEPELKPQMPARSLFEAEDADALKTQVLNSNQSGNDYQPTAAVSEEIKNSRINHGDYGPDDKTVAVTGFHKKPIENYEDKVKVSIGQSRSAYSPGYAAWGGSGSEGSLGQAENLRMAQEKILDLEKLNENLRLQNEDLISASDIIKERSDLLTAQITDYQNDKQNLEESFKNEIALLRGHLQRKDSDLQKAQLKIDDLDSRLKFDMKKIRIRERELENRLELIRAEKNTLTKSKDDQILDLRRKMDVMQMEVDSYRQKCVDLNKNLEVNQDSFKRTTRALRLAMANLELQEENKPALKKVD